MFFSETRCVYVIRLESYRIRWNYAAVKAITPYPRSQSSVPIESSYATSY